MTKKYPRRLDSRGQPSRGYSTPSEAEDDPRGAWIETLDRTAEECDKHMNYHGFSGPGRPGARRLFVDSTRSCCISADELIEAQLITKRIEIATPITAPR